MFGRQILHIEGRPAPFNDPAYQATLTSYQQEFGLKPGSRMWPTPEDEVPRARRIGAALVLGVTGLYAWGYGHGWLAAGAFGTAFVAFAMSALVTPWPVTVSPGNTSGCGGSSIGDNGQDCASDSADGGGGGCGGCGGD